MYIGTAKLLTPPASEPVTTAEAKLHLRVDSSDEDAFVDALVSAARATCEQWCGRVFLSQTWELYLNAFPSAECGSIYLPHPPLVSVTHVKYTDEDGVLQTLDPSVYYVDTVKEPGRVMPAFDKAWPACREFANSVVVRYVAGVATTDELDARVKQAIKLIVGHWYQNREAVLVGTIAKEIELAARMLMNQLWHGLLS